MAWMTNDVWRLHSVGVSGFSIRGGECTCFYSQCIFLNSC